MTFKLAHISDIHFFRFCKNPTQFFSKRWIGNFNAALTRKGIFTPSLAYDVALALKKQGVSHLLISGDFTSTSSKEEFRQAREYVQYLIRQGFTVYAFPGNHDTYTKQSAKSKAFYTYLDDLISFQGSFSYNLPEHRIAAYPLTTEWTLIMLDCAFATSLTKSTGLFPETLEASFKEILSQIPQNNQIIVSCHFPFKKHKYPYHHLERCSALETILHKDSRIRAYLHGHRHKAEIIKENHLFSIDGGSISLAKQSYFTLLTLKEHSLEAALYKRQNYEWEACKNV